MTDLALLVLGLVALAGLIRLLPSTREEQRPERIAERLGLEPQGDQVFEGRLQDRRVGLELHPGPAGTVGVRLAVELRRRLAPGLQVELSERGLAHVLGLDEALFHWDEEGPVLLGLGQDPIRARLQADRGLDFSPVRPDPALEDVELRLAVNVDAEELRVGFPQVDRSRLQDLVEACIELVELLEEAEDLPWLEAAEAHGLELIEGRLAGQVEGLRVQGRYESGRTRLDVDFGEVGLPTTLRIHDRGTGKLGSPVLDLLVGLEGPAPEDRRFDRPELAEALLAVVHQFPGSFVESRRLVLEADGRLREGLQPALEAALRLGRELRR